MEFDDFAIEARRIAAAVASYLQEQGYRVLVEHPIRADAPLRTSLLATRKSLSLLVEVQSRVKLEGAVTVLARWLANKHEYAELYVATRSDAMLSGGLLSVARSEGIGILSIDESGRVERHMAARNHALQVALHPQLSLGRHKVRVRELYERFNGGDRIDALRDLCELVEGETDMAAWSTCCQRMDYQDGGRCTSDEMGYADKHAVPSGNICVSTTTTMQCIVLSGPAYIS